MVRTTIGTPSSKSSASKLGSHVSVINYHLVNSQDSANFTSDNHNVEEDDLQRAVSLEAQESQEMKIYESYIMGMLTNLAGRQGGLPLNRIHNNLKMFASSGNDGKYDKSLQELRSLLSRLCNEEKLECIDGMYQLVRK